MFLKTDCEVRQIQHIPLKPATASTSASSSSAAPKRGLATATTTTTTAGARHVELAGKLSQNLAGHDQR